MEIGEKLLEKNKNDWHFFAGQLTVADVLVFECLDGYVEIFGSLDSKFDKFSKLKNLYSEVSKLSGIQKHIEYRKKNYASYEQYAKEVKLTLNFQFYSFVKFQFKFNIAVFMKTIVELRDPTR